MKIHSLYVSYILPMTCEIQYWEFPEPAACRRLSGRSRRTPVTAVRST